MDLAPMPWERQPKESPPAWNAFVKYRDMGLSRTCGKVAKGFGKSLTLMTGWCNEHDWVARVAAWDAVVDEEHRKQLLAAQKEMLTEHLKIANAITEKALAAFEEMPLIMPQDVIRALMFGVKLKQTTLGMPTERADISIAGKDPMAAYFDSLPENKLRQLVERALKENSHDAAATGPDDGQAEAR